jgi:transcription elongation factor Elf1
MPKRSGGDEVSDGWDLYVCGNCSISFTLEADLRKHAEDCWRDCQTAEQKEITLLKQIIDVYDLFVEDFIREVEYGRERAIEVRRKIKLIKIAKEITRA